MKYNAFITGSRKYGAPRLDSDLDLVVYMDPVDMALLVDNGCDSNDYGCTSVVAQFGDLNLIAFSNKRKFRAWARATAKLYKYRPFTREQAVAVIQAYLRSPLQNFARWLYGVSKR